MNSVTLIGRLTADPDLRFINTGTAISKFTIAIDRSYRKDNQAVTDFIPVEIWGKKAEYCATYIEKGCLVAISGSLHIDRFIDSTGNNRNYAKVVANSIMKLNTPNKNNGNSEINSGGDITDSETTVANTNIGGTDSEIGNQSNSQSTSSDVTNSQTSSSTNSSTTSNNPTNNSSLSDDPTSNLTACTDDDLPF